MLEVCLDLQTVMWILKEQLRRVECIRGLNISLLFTNVQCHRNICCWAQCWDIVAFVMVNIVGVIGILAMVYNGIKKEFTHNVKYFICRTWFGREWSMQKDMWKDNFQKTVLVSQCETALLYIPYSWCRADKQNQTKWHTQQKVCILLFFQLNYVSMLRYLVYVFSVFLSNVALLLPWSQHR